MEHRAGERLDAVDVRQLRLAEPALAADDEPRRDLALRGLHAPEAAGLVPLGALHLGPEADVRGDAVLVRALAQVVPDLRLQREQTRPLGVRRERERVEVRGNVALAARIRVVAP